MQQFVPRDGAVRLFSTLLKMAQLNLRVSPDERLMLEQLAQDVTGVRCCSDIVDDAACSLPVSHEDRLQLMLGAIRFIGNNTQLDRAHLRLCIKFGNQLGLTDATTEELFAVVLDEATAGAAPRDSGRAASLGLHTSRPDTSSNTQLAPR